MEVGISILMSTRWFREKGHYTASTNIGKEDTNHLFPWSRTHSKHLDWWSTVICFWSQKLATLHLGFIAKHTAMVTLKAKDKRIKEKFISSERAKV